jgi:glycosyltransferase involved in cell wall biosynthesis
VAPLISVVTATLNRREMLRGAIDSVMAQSMDDIEHIIVDGVSSDGTVEMLHDYPHLVVLSEVDTGLYDAWNKGIARATGRLICILNSDDEIPAGAFDAARRALAADPAIDMLSGPAEIVTDTSARTVRIIDDPRILSLREQDIGSGITLTNGRYMSAALLARTGLFNQDFPLVADRDFFLRALQTNPHHVMIEQHLYRYREHPGSLTLSGHAAVQRLASDSLKAARAGIDRAPAGSKLAAAYARWHAWAVFYAAGLRVRDGHIGQAMRIAADAFGHDRIWPLRLPMQVIRHVNERAARRGRIMGL